MTRPHFGTALAAALLAAPLIATSFAGSTGLAEPASFAESDRPGDFDANPTLAALQLEEVSPVRELDIHVEYLETAEFDRPDVVAAEVAELCAELTEAFDARYAELFGGAKERKTICIVVVNTLDTWLAARGERPATEGADFLDDVGERGTIVMYDLAWPGGSRKSRIEGLRLALGQALVAAGADVPAAKLPGALVLGAGHGLRATGPLPEGVPTVGQRLQAELREGGFEAGYLLALDAALEPKGMTALRASAAERTTETNAAEHWAGQRVARTGDLVAHAMDAALVAGGDAAAALQRSCAAALEGVAPDAADLALLDRTAWAALLAELRASTPGFDPRSVAGSPAFTQATADLQLPAPAAPVARAPEDALAQSAYLASIGRLDDAVQIAQASAQGSPELTRAAAGLKSIRDLRRAYLEHLAGTPDEKLRMQHDGRLLVAGVTRVGRETVFLAENVREVEALAIDDLPMAELVERMEKEAEPFGDSRARAWALALAGERYTGSLTKDDKADAHLGADLAAVEGRLERGRVLGLIAIAGDAAGHGADERLDAMRELAGSAANSADYIAARDELRAAAEELLAERFAGLDLTDLLGAAKVEQKGDTLTLEYDFKDAAQLGDWPRLQEYAPEWVDMLEPLETKEARFEVDAKAGELVLKGQVIGQHLLAFAAPVRVSYTFEIPKQGAKADASKTMADHVYVSVCDDLGWQHVRARHLGDLDIVDIETETNTFLVPETPLSYKMGKPYDAVLEVDAEGMARTKLDGKQAFEAAAPGRVSGRVVLMAHSEREVRIHELVIEGELAADQSALETIWVAAQLEGLGF